MFEGQVEIAFASGEILPSLWVFQLLDKAEEFLLLRDFPIDHLLECSLVSEASRLPRHRLERLVHGRLHANRFVYFGGLSNLRNIVELIIAR